MENQGDQTHTKPDQRHTKSDQIKKCGGRSLLAALGCASQKTGGRFGGFSIKLVCFFWLPKPATSSSLVDGLLLMADGHRGCAICTLRVFLIKRCREGSEKKGLFGGFSQNFTVSLPFLYQFLQFFRAVNFCL